MPSSAVTPPESARINIASRNRFTNASLETVRGAYQEPEKSPCVEPFSLVRAVARAASSGPECQAAARIPCSCRRPSEPAEPLGWIRRGWRSRMRLSCRPRAVRISPTAATLATPIRAVRPRRTSSVPPARRRAPLARLRRRYELPPMRAARLKGDGEASTPWPRPGLLRRVPSPFSIAPALAWVSARICLACSAVSL